MNSVAKSKKKGLLFAMVTASLWGVLPIALIGILSTIDPFTPTFFRFLMFSDVLKESKIWGLKKKLTISVSSQDLFTIKRKQNV